MRIKEKKKDMGGDKRYQRIIIIEITYNHDIRNDDGCRFEKEKERR